MKISLTYSLSGRSCLPNMSDRFPTADERWPRQGIVSKMNKRIKEDIVQILDNYEIDEFSMENEEDFEYLVKNLVDYVKENK